MSQTRSQHLQPGISDAARANDEARVVAALAGLTSYLATRRADGASLDEVKEEFRKASLDRFETKLEQLRAVRLPAWLYFRNPIWVGWYLLQLRLTKNREVDWSTLRILDESLGRAQFSRKLSEYSRNQLREAIQRHELSAFGALTLVRSLGCVIDESKHLQAYPVGKTGLIAGIFFGVLLGSVFALFLLELVVQVQSECPQDCVMAGSLWFMQMSGLFLSMTYSLSYGRQRVAKKIKDLYALSLSIERQDQLQPAP